MLHIVNGDVVGEMLKKVVSDDILVWREIYTEGPVWKDMSNQTVLSDRAAYLEENMGIPSQDFIERCIWQEKQLDQIHRYNEIVLWFEHDLFDQTMLCYLLHRLSELHIEPTKINLLCIGSFPDVEDFRGLGQLSIDQLETLIGTWEPINQSVLNLGERLWNAYSASEPYLLIDLLKEDTSDLPFAKNAFQFHLSRFPSLQNGLSIVEKETMIQLEQGTNEAKRLFKKVSSQYPWFGIGDLQYWTMLKRMSSGKYPLIQKDDHTDEFHHGTIEMTQSGRRVMEGIEDRIALNGLDCWLGGVHLYGKDNIWRWDEQERALVKSI